MEVAPAHQSVPVSEPSQPSAARLAAKGAAERASFDEEDSYRAALIASELATNLVKHATGGELLIRSVRKEVHREVEIISIDRGPGMADVSRSLADGHSTAGTSGNGLGAVHRLADEFDIYSQPGRGTVVFARLYAGRRAPASESMLEFGGVSVAKTGETICGDAWQVYSHSESSIALLADGLGHGLKAGEAAGAAIATVDRRKEVNLVEFLRTMHVGMKHTRGAAVAIAEILPRRRIFKFAGVGNISAAVTLSGLTRHAVSLNGTLGHEARAFREFSYPWDRDAILVMYSDGLGSHWSLDKYPGLRQRLPTVIAAVLYRDFSRQRDDVTVLIARESA
jgi:anti-sigma regulatory factor (Ser/Thr protein kinase)